MDAGFHIVNRSAKTCLAIVILASGGHQQSLVLKEQPQVVENEPFFMASIERFNPQHISS